MRLHLLTVGNKMPTWVDEAYQDYAKRLPPDCSLTLHELPAAPRTKVYDAQKAMVWEAEKILDKVPQGAHIIALDERGTSWRSTALAEQFSRWRDVGADVYLVIGGTDGLAPAVKTRAQQLWCVSPLTLPHGMMRVVVAEALYRAWSITAKHPYHRA